VLQFLPVKIALSSSQIISDNKWHVVTYRRNGLSHALIVDKKTDVNFSSESNANRNYDILYIGENNTLTNATIEMEEFIWEFQQQEINFVKGVYESFGSRRNEYVVISNGVVPLFNRKLPIRDRIVNVSLTTGMGKYQDISLCISCQTKTTINTNTHEYGDFYSALFLASPDAEDGCKECHSNAYCNNSNESHECSCKTGYVGDGIHN
jgi:hypothetical protein